MDNNQLHAFIAVAEAGSFSLAAENLRLTQPAVSKRIALLESRLGASLFDRIGKQNRLTAAGELALVRARRIISEGNALAHDIENLAGSISGKLVISTSHHIGLHRLPSILKDYVRRYPEVELDMRFTDSEIAYHDVQHGEATLAIATLPNQDKHKQVTSLPLWLDDLVLVCAPNHPLCQGTYITLDQLEQHHAILPGSETFTRRIINDYFNSNHLTLKIAFETNYLETIRVMVASGLGWSVLPRILTGADIQMVNFESLKLTRTLGAMINTHITLPNSAQAMIELLKQKSDYHNLTPRDNTNSSSRT